MTSLSRVIVLIAALPASAFAFQARSIPEDVRRAEAEGSRYRRAAGNADSVAPRKCVNGIGMGPARSGQFTIGGNLSGMWGLQAGHVGKVWWTPVYRGKEMPPLEVRARSLTRPRDTTRYTTTRVAYTVSGATRTYFFPSGIMIPNPGRWLVVASSGDNWGCFILTVNDSMGRSTSLPSTLYRE